MESLLIYKQIHEVYYVDYICVCVCSLNVPVDIEMNAKNSIKRPLKVNVKSGFLRRRSLKKGLGV